MSRSVKLDTDALRESQRQAQELLSAVKTRRLRKCIAEGAHQPDSPGQGICPRCGQ